MSAGEERFVVLMYHALEEPDRPATGDPGALVYAVRREAFERHIDTLGDLGARVATHGDLDGAAAGDRAVPVIITFDDGHASDVSVALPVLRARGMRAVFFITTGRIGTGGHLDEDGVALLHRAGMTVGSHGVTHRYLTGLGGGELREELSGSKRRLEDITGAPADSLSAPGGRIDRRVLESAKEAGYRYIYGSKPRLNRGFPADAPIGRFAITRGCTDSRFARIASGDPPRSIRLRHAALDAARRALGDPRYDRLRSRLLGGG